MSKSRQHLSSISAGPDAGASNSATALRDVALAVIVGALLLTGVAVGGSLAPRQDPLLAQPVDTAAAQPAQEFEYFPSQYVNQGVGILEDIATF